MGEQSPAGQMRPEDYADTRALAALLDPVALEARLSVARAKRAEALAGRPQSTAPRPPALAQPGRAPASGFADAPAASNRGDWLAPPQPEAPDPTPDLAAPRAGEAMSRAPLTLPTGEDVAHGAATRAAKRRARAARWRIPALAAGLAFAAGAGVSLAVAFVAPVFFGQAPPATAPAATSAASPGALASVALVAPAPQTAAPLAAAPAIVAVAPTPSIDAFTGPTLAPAPVLAPPVAPNPPAATPEAAVVASPPGVASVVEQVEPGLTSPAVRPRPRPDGASPTQGAAPAIADAGATAPGDASPPAADTAATTGPTRLMVHAPRGVSDAVAASAVAALSAAGHAASGPVRVGFGISRNNVRYYHAEDAARAEAVAAALAAELGPVDTRDFTDYSPRPAPGTVEVWMAGDPGRAAVRRAPRQPAAPGISDEIRRLVDAVAAQQEDASRDITREARRLGNRADAAARRVESALTGAFRAIGGAP